MSRTRPTAKRRGQSLLIMVLLLVVLAGVLALTLDFGFVLLSRRTMQTAVNAGALEGARDIGGNGRVAARAVIRNVADDDLDPTENNTTLGMGPDQNLVQRDVNDNPRLGTGVSSRAVFENRAQYIYRPTPELNTDNALHGDLVRGTYDGDGTSHLEDDAYLRDDFAATTSGDAFLARLRRTPVRSNIANPLDRQSGVSSSGSGSPLLMGHLAWFRANSSDSYDIRRDGIAIRATAIADAKPVVHVGSASQVALYPSRPYGFVASDNEWYELDSPAFSLGDVRTRIDQDPSTPAIDPVDVSTVADEDFVGYAPVVAEVDGQFYAIGFLLNTRGESRIPNASPRLQDAWPTLSALAPDVREEVLRLHRELNDVGLVEVDTAPALVRSVR